MKFKTGEFFIQKKDFSFEKKKGYFDDSFEFSFHKSFRGWVVSDVATGAAIVWKETRKACAEFVENNYSSIEKARNNQTNIEARKRMERFIEEHR